ncbi:hypothetical protein LTS01_025929, partial [Friedmanniomyces endolithicus]
VEPLDQRTRERVTGREATTRVERRRRTLQSIGAETRRLALQLGRGNGGPSEVHGTLRARSPKGCEERHLGLQRRHQQRHTELAEYRGQYDALPGDSAADRRCPVSSGELSHRQLHTQGDHVRELLQPGRRADVR